MQILQNNLSILIVVLLGVGILFFLYRIFRTKKTDIIQLNEYTTDVVDDIYAQNKPLKNDVFKQKSISDDAAPQESAPEEKSLKRQDEVGQPTPPQTPKKEPKEPLEETHAQELAMQEQPQEVPHNHNPQSRAKKVSVPPHGKISKEDFKHFSGIKVLVAEDNLINQKVIAGLLDGSGIVLEFANDGLEAISYLNNQKDFDIVLMDAHMPNLDGFEATRKIREHEEFSDIPVVALSGDVAKDDIKKMYESGMDAHLEKPLKMDALYDVLYAFTTKEEENKKEAKEQTQALKFSQLDTQKGIAISGGDEGFYKEILQEFLQDYENAHENVKELLSKGKLKDADALLLDIMGITANIGAETLHSDSMRLKQSLQNVKTGEYKPAFKAFHTSFKELVEQIKSYLS